MQSMVYILHPFLIQYLHVLSIKYKTVCILVNILIFNDLNSVEYSDHSEMDKHKLT